MLFNCFRTFRNSIHFLNVISIYQNFILAAEANMLYKYLAFILSVTVWCFSSSAYGSNMIKVDLGRQTWTAYDSGGNFVRSGHVSGGKNYCPDIRRRCRTVTGTFTIYSKRGASCKSTRFPVGRGGAPMPYCMFFHGGYALHGSYSVPNYNASHGCVRMFPEDARWLNQNFVVTGSTRVSVRY